MKPLTDLRNVPFGTVLKIGAHEGELRHWRTEAIHMRIDRTNEVGPATMEYVVRFEVLLGENLFFAFEDQVFDVINP